MSETTTCKIDPTCDAESLGYCITCHLPFCVDHASEIDPNHYCETCLKPEAVEFKIEPLTDKEGVTHKGRKVVPIGEMWRTGARTVADMSDEDLLLWIQEYKSLVHTSELALEYNRNILRMSEFERDERSIARQRALVGVKVDGRLHFIGKMAAERRERAKTLRSSSAKPTVQTLFEKLKAAGVTPEMMAVLAASAKKKVG